MRLNKEAGAILGRERIGMLALRSGRMPIINPAAFSFGSGSIWMTTSRFAVKTVLARRDPRAAFFVDGGPRALLVRGTLEVYDPLSVSAQVRALLGGPAFYLGMAGYTLKNAPFIAGYLLDLAGIPREWLPYNRVVLRLKPTDADLMDVGDFPEAQAARVPAVPAEISRRLAGVGRAYVCWLDGAKPVVEAAYWEVEQGQLVVAPIGSRHPRPGTGGAVVIESHHQYRPSLMVGASVRGSFDASDSVREIAERYDIAVDSVPPTLRLEAERVTSWRGFAITSSVPRGARHLHVAEG